MTETDPAPTPWQAHYAHPCAWDMDFPPLTLPEMFAQSAARFAERPLVDFMGRAFTYAALHAEARAFAAGLQRLGVAKGDRIGLYLPNVPIYVSAYYGAMLAGATVVNFSPLYTAQELAAQVEDSGTRLLVTIDSAALLPTALEVLKTSGLERLVVGSLAAMLPLAKGLALRLLGRKSLTRIPARPDVIRWEDALARTDPAPVLLDPLEGGPKRCAGDGEPLRERHLRQPLAGLDLTGQDEIAQPKQRFRGLLFRRPFLIHAHLFPPPPRREDQPAASAQHRSSGRSACGPTSNRRRY